MKLPAADNSPRPWWFVVVRAAVLALIVFLAVMTLLNIPLAYRGALAFAPYTMPDAQWTAAELRAALAQSGMPIEVYGAAQTVVPAARVLAYIVVGLLILWRRSHTWFGLYLAVELLVFATTSTNGMYGIKEALPWMRPALSFLGNLGWIFLPILLYAFPDGRFVPRWGSLVLATYVFVMIKVAFFDPPSNAPSPFEFAVVSLTFLIGIGSQVYRYRRASHAFQRQQTKWILWAMLFYVIFAVISLGTLEARRQTVGTSAGGLLFGLVASALFAAISTAIPVSIGIAILRYRLWDIDVIIRRTVTYALLTALLLITYFGGVVVLQQVFVALTGQRSELAIILSTLGLAALAVPLRNRIQSAIDRRFFRAKYDAAKVLETFAIAARDETDLSKLSNRLLDVVEETLKPVGVSLWLQAARDKTRVGKEAQE